MNELSAIGSTPFHRPGGGSYEFKYELTGPVLVKTLMENEGKQEAFEN